MSNDQSGFHMCAHIFVLLFLPIKRPQPPTEVPYPFDSGFP